MGIQWLFSAYRMAKTLERLTAIYVRGSHNT
jgi:hypothetical protein